MCRYRSCTTRNAATTTVDTSSSWRIFACVCLPFIQATRFAPYSRDSRSCARDGTDAIDPLCAPTSYQLKGMSEAQADAAFRSLALFHSFAWGKDLEFEQGGKWCWWVPAPLAVCDTQDVEPGDHSFIVNHLLTPYISSACVRVLVQRIPLRQELLHHIASLWNETQYTPFLQTIFQRWFECEASVAPQWGEGPQAMVYVPIRLHATNDALAHNDDWLALVYVPQKSHGDYRTDNLFFTEDASGVAMIDFQLIRRGGPIAVLQDVAYLLVISTCTRPNSLIVAAALT